MRLHPPGTVRAILPGRASDPTRESLLAYTTLIILASLINPINRHRCRSPSPVLVHAPGTGGSEMMHVYHLRSIDASCFQLFPRKCDAFDTERCRCSGHLPFISQDVLRPLPTSRRSFHLCHQPFHRGAQQASRWGGLSDSQRDRPSPSTGGVQCIPNARGGCSKLLPSLNRGSTRSLSVAIATNRGVFIGLSWRHALDRWRNFTYSQIRLVSELDLRSYVTHVNSRCRLRWTLTRVLS